MESWWRKKDKRTRWTERRKKKQFHSFQCKEQRWFLCEWKNWINCQPIHEKDTRTPNQMNCIEWDHWIEIFRSTTKLKINFQLRTLNTWSRGKKVTGRQKQGTKKTNWIVTVYCVCANVFVCASIKFRNKSTNNEHLKEKKKKFDQFFFGASRNVT